MGLSLLVYRKFSVNTQLASNPGADMVHTFSLGIKGSTVKVSKNVQHAHQSYIYCSNKRRIKRITGVGNGLNYFQASP
jgi:hypothetical protein